MNKEQQINIELPEKEAEGIYSNVTAIGYNNSEFILDFIRLMPGLPKGKVHARIVMTPQNAKAFYESLSNSIKQYEEKFGEIKKTENNPKIGF